MMEWWLLPDRMMTFHTPSHSLPVSGNMDNRNVSQALGISTRGQKAWDRVDTVLPCLSTAVIKTHQKQLGEEKVNLA